MTAAQIVSAVPIDMARLPETSLTRMSSTAGFYAVKPLDLVSSQKKQADDLMSGSANGAIFPDTAAARIFFFVLIARERNEPNIFLQHGTLLPSVVTSIFVFCCWRQHQETCTA